ncbi:hypothetical protein GCM10008014_09100 [Paenibacillus silvae]|uniref:Tetratricopeptide repeat protein n=1 Tax=Paenibacillus silvae TaxID=1325358 RepID=A0ABQ1Z3H3_9BACL|nr:hypothetical protein [Paenibacillus silvae]GGH46434.1 hypothetical protein GCM10008014_09100 [Paenibacillus silvae]
MQVARNLLGKGYEKEGQLDKAIELYEANVNEGFEGNFPYDRLCIIYNKMNRYADVKRVLERAVYIFENAIYKDRGDKQSKLDKFRKQLEKANENIT